MPFKKKKAKKTVFVPGYQALMDRLVQSSRVRYIKSCYNCQYFFKGEHDKEEVCQNRNVTSYDVDVTDSNIVCSYWIISNDGKKEHSVEGLFKRRVL